MQSSAENFIPILFKVLFGFVSLNIIINLILLYTRPSRLNKLLAIYWPCLFLHFILQGQFQAGDLKTILAYSAALGIFILMGMIAFETVGRTFPIKKYLIFFLPFYPLTIWLHSLGYGFTVVAMPFSIATAIPIAHSGWVLLKGSKGNTTRLQKVLGIVYFLNSIHCINFALFRMDPGSQLWGWLVSYTLCDVLAILLPSIALEQIGITDKKRLQDLVDEKTNHLKDSLITNDNLFRVLIHDISNPLSVMKVYLHFMHENPEKMGLYFDKLQKSQTTMEELIAEVRKMYLQKTKAKAPLGAVDIEECFRELTFIFEQRLKDKNVRLLLNNQLSPHTLIKANHTSLTHSILSNLISNSIKFASPGCYVELTAMHSDARIVLDLKDNGPGIPQHIVKDLMDNKELPSMEGTSGEKGSGLGLSIAKSFVESYGGHFNIVTHFMHTDPKEYGTNIQITLDAADGSSSPQCDS